MADRDLLPVHKYAELGLTYPLAATVPPDEALVNRVREQFRGMA